MTYYEIYTKEDDKYYLYNIRAGKNDAINEADDALRDDDEHYVEVREVTGENVKVVYSKEKNDEEGNEGKGRCEYKKGKTYVR